MKTVQFFVIAIFLITAPFVYSQNERTSKVPMFKYSTTLEEQKKDLENNPLLKRYKKSREELSVDKHRPYYHFTSPEGRLNDPNGLCYWNNKWHLFYQAYPPEDTRQHWGHAISDDLIHWQDLPIAIYPNPEDKVYSGTTLVEKDRTIAIYHGVGSGTMIATSSDPLLLNWEKLPENPIVALPKPGEKLPYNVFDPCIWKKGDYYFSLLAGTRPVGPGGKNMRANFLFRSKDLKNWEYLHPFVEDDYYSIVGDDGACPYFWPIGDKGKYILLHFSHKSGGKYLIGDYDTQKDKFIVTNGGNFNHGPVSHGGVHAPSACPDGKGGIIVIFNTNSGKKIGQGNFTEMMTLPWLLTLNENEDLMIQPIGDIESLRSNHASEKNISLPANKEIVLDKISGNSIEINMEIDLLTSPGFEINVLKSPDKEEYTRILFYKDGGYPDRTAPGKNQRASAIAIDNSRGSLSDLVRPRVVETADVILEKNETLKIRIFIDRSIVEVFVNGRQCIAVRSYPEKEDSKGFSIRSFNKDALLKHIECWQMDNIYK